MSTQPAKPITRSGRASSPAIRSRRDQLPTAHCPLPTVPPALAADPAAAARRLNRWRDGLNPLRGLTIAAAISRLDNVQRGITADAQWTYQLIERRDEDLIGVIESTSNALVQLNWYVRTCEGDARRQADWDEILAADQAAALLSHYNRVRNLYDAIKHLSMAYFRGYAHVQVAADGKWLADLGLLDQWNVCRDGFRGDWYWNPEAQNVPVASLPPSNRLDPSAYVVLETPRPVDEVALVKHLRCSMSAKDWDAFIEIYGIPSWIITLPASVPAGQESEYRDAAAAVAAGGSGAIPNGSDAKAAAYPAGTAPFAEHLRYWSERLVIAATGGLLTSVALPTGIGSGAAEEHAATFERIARGRARMISEAFQRTIDAAILDAAFPGRPHLAYFDLDAREETDTAAVVAQILSLSQAGYRVDPAQVAERTGYNVTPAPAAPPPPAFPFASRAGQPLSRADQAAARAYAEAVRADLRPLAEALWPLLELEGDALRTALARLVQNRRGLAAEILNNSAAAGILDRLMAESAAAGILDATEHPAR